MNTTEPKINQECQKCLVPMHQAQVRVGQLTTIPCITTYSLYDHISFYLLEPDKLQFGDVILNVDAVRMVVIKNYSPKHIHLKFKVT